MQNSMTIHDPSSSEGNSLLATESGQKALRQAALFWMILATAVSIKTIAEPVAHSVYPVFELGALSWRADRNMYIRTQYEFEYPPPFAAAFAPLTMLPTWAGGVLWSLLNVGVLYWSLRQLIQYVFPTALTPNQQRLFSILVIAASARGLWSAQSNMLVFALVAGAAAAMTRKQWWWAAFLFAIPVYIKVWPVAAAMLFMACWPRQLIGRFVVAIAAIGLFPMLTKSPSIVLWQYANYVEVLTGAMQVREPYRDAWMIWEQVCPPVNPTVYRVLQLGSALGALGLSLWQRFRAPTEKHALTFILSIWVAWQMTFGPGVERNTFCLAAPVISWALITSLDTRDRPKLMITAFAVTTLFSFGVFERMLSGVAPVVLGAFPAGVFLFAYWLVAHARWVQASVMVATDGSPMFTTPVKSSRQQAA